MRIGRRRTGWWAALAALAALAGLADSATAAGPVTATAPVRVTVARAIDGDTLALADGGTLRLAAVMAPKPPRSGNRALTELAERARAALDGQVAGSIVTVEAASRATDRYGRLTGLVRDADGRLAQETLLAAGLARVAPSLDQRAGLAPLLAAEATARAAGRGLWAMRLYAVRTPAEARAERDGFVIVEGRVSGQARGSGQTRLTLGGADDGIVLTLRGPALKLFRTAGVKPADLVGRPLRARGWLTGRDGPAIEITVPEQIERLDG